MFFLSPEVFTTPPENLLKISVHYSFFPEWNGFKSTTSLWSAGISLKFPFEKKISVTGFFYGSKWWWKLGGEGLSQGAIRFSMKGKHLWGSFGSTYSSRSLDYSSATYIYARGWNPFFVIGGRFRLKKYTAEIASGFRTTGKVFLKGSLSHTNHAGKNLLSKTLSLEAGIEKSENFSNLFARAGFSWKLNPEEKIGISANFLKKNSLVWENDEGMLLNIGLNWTIRGFTLNLMPSLCMKPVLNYGLLLGVGIGIL